MSKKMRCISFGLVIAFFAMAGCGGEKGNGWQKDGKTRVGREGGAEVKIVLCPKSGGSVKFLNADSLELIDSDLDVPFETIGVGMSPIPSTFAALTGEAIYLVPTVGNDEIRPVTLPAISGDVRVVSSTDGLIVLDRLARRLIGVNLREGTITFDRTLNQYAEEIYYVEDQDKIVLIMKKGTSGVVSVFSPVGGESITINLDQILCSAIAAGEGRIYLATGGFESRAALEAFRIEDLSRIFDVDLEELPGSLVCVPGRGKIYAYYPQSGIVRGIDLDRGEVISEIPLDEREEAALHTDEIGRYVYLLHKASRKLTVISTKTDLIAGEIEGQDGDTKLLTVPDSRYIILQDKEGTRIRLYDGDNFQLLRVFMEEQPMEVGIVRCVTEPPREEEIQLVEKEADRNIEEGGTETASTAELSGVSKSFVIQVFASNDLSASERVSDDLLSLGFPAAVEEVVSAAGKTWYRVEIGFFSDREDARAVGEYLRLVRGLESWVRTIGEGEAAETSARPGDLLQGQDMDSDGTPEIAVVGSGGAVRIFSLRSNRFVPRWNMALPADQALCGVITYADESGDGVPEAILPLCPLDDNFMIAWDGARFQGGSEKMRSAPI